MDSPSVWVLAFFIFFGSAYCYKQIKHRYNVAQIRKGHKNAILYLRHLHGFSCVDVSAVIMIELFADEIVFTKDKNTTASLKYDQILDVRKRFYSKIVPIQETQYDANTEQFYTSDSDKYESKSEACITFCYLSHDKHDEELTFAYRKIDIPDLNIFIEMLNQRIEPKHMVRTNL